MIAPPTPKDQNILVKIEAGQSGSLQTCADASGVVVRVAIIRTIHRQNLKSCGAAGRAFRHHAIGAERQAKFKAIVSRLVAIEKMAGTDVLCGDKTGPRMN